MDNLQHLLLRLRQPAHVLQSRLHHTRKPKFRNSGLEIALLIDVEGDGHSESVLHRMMCEPSFAHQQCHSLMTRQGDVVVVLESCPTA